MYFFICCTYSFFFPQFIRKTLIQRIKYVCPKTKVQLIYIVRTAHAIPLMRHFNKATRGNGSETNINTLHGNIAKIFSPEATPGPFPENRGARGNYRRVEHTHCPGFFSAREIPYLDFIFRGHPPLPPCESTTVDRVRLWPRITKHGIEKKKEKERKKGKIWNINKTYSYRRQVQ